MSEETKRFPDAVMAPVSWKVGSNSLERGIELAKRAEAALGLEGAQRAYVRLATGSHHFCTASPEDTIYFPTVHARAGRDRYRWEEQPDGSRFGYYVDDEARDCYSAKA